MALPHNGATPPQFRSPQLEIPFTLTETCQPNFRNRGPLLEAGWDHWLQNHPNPGLQNKLLDIIRYGAFIGYTGPPRFILGENLASALKDPTSITTDLEIPASPSQIHSITTGTCTEARWHLEENAPPIVAKRALCQRLYTPSVGHTYIHTTRRRHSRSTGLRNRSSLHQTRPRRCISPHPRIPRRLLATSIQLNGNMGVRTISPIRLLHIVSHL